MHDGSEVMVVELLRPGIAVFFGSSRDDWAALFRIRTAHLSNRERSRKGDLEIAYSD